MLFSFSCRTSGATSTWMPLGRVETSAGPGQNSVQSSGRRPWQLPWQLRLWPPPQPRLLLLQQGLLRGYCPCCPVLLMMQLILATPRHVTWEVSAMPLPPASAEASLACQASQSPLNGSVTAIREVPPGLAPLAAAEMLLACLAWHKYEFTWASEGHPRGTLLRRR